MIIIIIYLIIIYINIIIIDINNIINVIKLKIIIKV